ncbi:plasmid replication protein, CyRepA1 family [Nannocystis sp. SCPEA4]|uniref:plasmid replication protein, CyRepA1 family n=1 Tax=Nannocystis sp. SCPEA4 TaxID=2996787 RepID=UPI002270B2D0|nr:plasmid replication protein, CyRepA1 family [Nannocystis sp. SCPEA4]MCY1055415.1 hypothetical protein [Nannocystis sp. SCPEA4]
MSLPTDTTVDSLRGEADQATLLGDEDREAHEVEEQRLKPPKTSKCEFALGGGRMAVAADGAAIQVPAAVRPGLVTLSRLYDMISLGRKICSKYDAPCIYAAVPRRRGSSKKANVAYVQMIALDLDGTIRDEASLAKHRRWCALYSSILYSTARHDPLNGSYRLRVLLPINASLSYEEARLVARAVCGQLAAYLGTSEGIDPCCERPFQPMLLPGWADQRIADQAICELHTGDVMDVSIWLADARRELEEAESEKRARACAVVATRRPRVASAAVVGAAAGLDVDGIDGIDRLERARADLDDLGPITRGSGRSNRDLFKAATILRDWEVDLQDAIDEMRSRYSDQDPEWLAAKTRSAYDAGAGSPRTGWRYRAATAEQGLTCEGEFDLENPPVAVAAGPVVTDGVLGSFRESTPCGTGQAVTHARPRRVRREINTPRLDDLGDFAALGGYRVVGIQSATGTRKNQHLRPAIAGLLAAGGRIVTLAHLRALTRRQSADWGLPNYQDCQGQIHGSTTVCLDSVGRIAAGPIDVVILDEAMQLFRHLFAETLAHKGQVGAVFTALRDVLRRAKRIILLDADLTPTAFFYIRVLLGEEPDELLIRNHWRGSRRIRVRSLEGMFSDLVARVSQGEKAWLYCTSAEAAKAYDLRLRTQLPGISVALVYSETSAQFEAHFKAPRLFGGYNVVIASPSIGTGVSVEHEGVWHVFGDCMSGCGPTAQDAKQGLCRVRDPQSITICMHGRKANGDTNAERQLADLLTKSERTIRRLRGQQWAAKYQHGLSLKEIPTGEFGLSESGEHIPDVEIHPADLDICRIQAEVLADEARNGNHLHDIELKDEHGAVIEVVPGALRSHLKESGFWLDDIPDELALDVAAIKADRKEAKKALKSARVEMRHRAKDLTPEEARVLEDAGVSSPEEAAELDRHKIRKAYGIKGPIPLELIERDDKGRRRRQLRVFGELRAYHRGEAQALDRLDRLDARIDPSSKKAQVVAAQQGQRARQAKLRAGLWALFGIGDLETEAKAGTVLRDPGDLTDHKELAREVKRYLGITIPGGSPMLLARALAEQAGVKLAGKQVRLADGKRVREYRLELDSTMLMVEDSNHYFGGITEPGKVPDPGVMAAANMEEIIAGITAEEDFRLAA